ncbi:MAG: tRNA 2-thiouridine(34) synthase MnmA [Desulfobacteraceae bacterium IS3]|nr:MAG: tRNA 2-thiouridine(34) synthase MnmA [Desulfobacteraceae bacterium IS3]
MTTTAIAISGGIDSLVAAYLLKDAGHDVVGVHFTTGYERESSVQISRQIRNIGDRLGIKTEIADCSSEFKSKVVDYFIRTYLNGQTPNPCLVCNPCIKFGAVPDIARKDFGASRLATGHYARVIPSVETHGCASLQDSRIRWRLLKGLDAKKDQSYFLAFLSQEQLASACFPLGEMTKSQVRELAASKGLTPVVKAESQDVCFIRGTDYGEFLVRECGVKPEPGAIEDVSGKVLGEHRGLHLFTVGQRRGINCPATEPYYVVRIDRQNNRLIVGFKQDLLSWECRVSGINWIAQEPASPVKVFVRVRYRHNAAGCTLFPQDRRTAIVRFDSAQSAVTPGQGAVFYDGDEVLGGGWIEG